MQSVLPVRNSISLVPPRQAEQHYSPCPVPYAKDWVKTKKLSQRLPWVLATPTAKCPC
jgi:hypothetical protein